MTITYELPQMQELIGNWVREQFGKEVFEDTRDRSLRMIEEPIELCQAIGIERADVQRVLDIVYSRPRDSNVKKELGQSLFVILALAATLDISASDELYYTWLDANTSETKARVQRRQQEKKDAGL